MNFEIINKSENQTPIYQTDGASGLDLRANMSNPITLKPMERRLISTGIFVNMTNDLEAQVRPRSGLAYKHGITVLNAPGTIDSDYKDEVKVILINLSDKDFYIENGDRIAQLVFCPVFKNPDYAKGNERKGGFGSTNIK